MVGIVVGDERADALEDDPLVRGRPAGEVRAGEPGVSGGDSGGQPGCARRRRDAEVEVLHHREGVVLHDADVEGRAPAAVALGQQSGIPVPRKPMRWM